MDNVAGSEPNSVESADSANAHSLLIQHLEALMSVPPSGNQPGSLILVTPVNVEATQGTEKLKQDTDSMALQLGKLIRGSDVLVRMEITKFAVVLRGTSATGAQHVARKIQQKIAAPSSAAATLALGMATYPDNAMSARELLRCAEEALNRARNAGGGILAAETTGAPAGAVGGGQDGPVLVRDAVPAWSTVRFADGGASLDPAEWESVHGQWKIEGEYWCGCGSGDNIIVWRRNIPGSFRLTCEGWSDEGRDLCVFGRAFEGERGSHWGYAFHVGAEANLVSKLSRRALVVNATRGTGIEANRKYRLELVYDDPTATIDCFLDGVHLFHYCDPFRLIGSQIGFYSWNQGSRMRLIELKYETQPRQESALRLADLLFENGDVATALKRYREVAARNAGSMEGLQATFKSGVCLARLERLAAARDVFRSLRGTSLEPYAMAEEATQYFLPERSQLHAKRGVEVFENLFQRFPHSDARRWLWNVGGETGLRGGHFAPTRAADLKIRQRVKLLGRDSRIDPLMWEIFCQVEYARMAWLAGEWKQSLDEMLRFWPKMLPGQYTHYSADLALYTCALANGRDDLLPNAPVAMQHWESMWTPDWCTGQLLHCVVRKDDAARWLAAHQATAAKEPDHPWAIELRNGVMLLALSLKQIDAARDWLQRIIIPNHNPEFYRHQYYVGGALVDARNDELYRIWMAQCALAVQKASENSMEVEATEALLMARWALEAADFDGAAKALANTVTPPTIYHFDDLFILQVLLSSLGYRMVLPSEELAAQIAPRVAGTALDLCQMFLGQKDPVPGAAWPHALWRPEWRLWLALWLEAKGRKDEARSIAQAALDPRYGLTHSQPALRLLLSRLGGTSAEPK